MVKESRMRKRTERHEQKEKCKKTKEEKKEERRKNKERKQEFKEKMDLIEFVLGLTTDPQAQKMREVFIQDNMGMNFEEFHKTIFESQELLK
jgi:hypothetical protein